MKSAVVSGIILLLIFIFVGTNTAVVDGMLEKTISSVSALDKNESTEEDFRELCDAYHSRAKYINLTVSHVMMSEVEVAFAEMEGAVLSADEDGFVQAKSRLIDALSQLKRLAGLSFDSII